MTIPAFNAYKECTTLPWMAREMIYYCGKMWNNLSGRPPLPQYLEKNSNGGVLGCNFWQDKREQPSMKASGMMRLGVGRERRKGGTVCWRELPDMRLSSSTWHVFERSWLWRTDSREGGMERETGETMCGKRGCCYPASFNQTGQPRTLLSQHNYNGVLSGPAHVVLPLAHPWLWTDGTSEEVGGQWRHCRKTWWVGKWRRIQMVPKYSCRQTGTSNPTQHHD